MEVTLGPARKRSGIDMELFKKQYRLVGPVKNQCWNWTGEYYGPASFIPTAGGRNPAVRWIFETMIGSLPERIVLMPDEKCTLSNNVPRGKRVPERGHCVNPEHYYAMTPLDAYRLDLGNKAKDECVNGHPYSQDTVTYSVQNRQVFCRVCRGESLEEPTKPLQTEVVVAQVKKQNDKESLMTPTSDKQSWTVKLGEPLTYAEVDMNEFMSHVKKQGDKPCLVWTGAAYRSHRAKGTRQEGHLRPMFRTADGKENRAHRWIFEIMEGELPDDTVLIREDDCDELCVDPTHQIPLTRSEYMSSRKDVRKKLFCLNGHRYAPGTFEVNSKGYRKCLICAANAQKVRKQKRLMDWVTESWYILHQLIEDMPEDEFDEVVDTMYPWLYNLVELDDKTRHHRLQSLVEQRRERSLKASEPEPEPVVTTQEEDEASKGLPEPAEQVKQAAFSSGNYLSNLVTDRADLRDPDETTRFLGEEIDLSGMDAELLASLSKFAYGDEPEPDIIEEEEPDDYPDDVRDVLDTFREHLDDIEQARTEERVKVAISFEVPLSSSGITLMSIMTSLTGAGATKVRFKS
jgi:hypothetical protein